MIRLGICTSIDRIDQIAAIGYDYLECGISGLCALSQEEFDALARKADAASIDVETFNVLLPGDIKITGPEADEQRIGEYLAKAFARMARLNGNLVVFGSGEARKAPEGWPADKAWRQVAAFLTQCNAQAEQYGITIAIEPLRRAECNILNYVSEAVLLSSLLDLSHVRVLGDTYHMRQGSEPLDALRMAGTLLRHVHISHDVNRTIPAQNDGCDYKEVFDVLKSIDYTGRVSVEAGTDGDFLLAATQALQVLKKAQQ